ncbi:E3 ubiquitin-protein ligase MARCHF3-like isoform X2 [Rhipicephalus microplus]|uniref:E3 ubiquitin-protein ligase MARCHF3-like isoform X2 n=1 Tax=Rhipicephalus microplus TaxID=6941 RepID=UPI003F6D0367
MAASYGRTAICLGASRVQNCLTAGCKPIYFSSSAMQPAHMQAKSWSAPLEFCAGHRISIRLDTDINNNGTIGFVHRECLESWIQRTVDPQCQVCHFHFTVRKQAQPIWCLLSDAEYRCPVFGYLALGALFVLGIGFVFPLAWLYAVCLPTRVGDTLAAAVVVVLAVQNILWLYFPFVSFRSSYKAYKKWHEESTRLKLVLSSTETSGPVWSNRCFWRTGGGSQDHVLT